MKQKTLKGEKAEAAVDAVLDGGIDSCWAICIEDGKLVIAERTVDGRPVCKRDARAAASKAEILAAARKAVIVRSVSE